MATLNLSKIKYMSETNLKKFASLIISLSSQVTDVENKCIKPYVDGELYPRDSYVSYNGYIYQATATNQDGAFNEAHWDKLSDDFNELTVADIEAMLGLSSEQLETMANLIADTEVRLDKTYSSSKIYQDIQQCLNDSKAFTLLELGKFSGASYKVVASTSEMTSESIIYLLASGNTYDMYIVEEDRTTTKIGNMNIDLSQYVKVTDLENDYLKKADADGKFATITTVDGKVDKDKIVTALDDSVTDEDIPSAKTIFDTIMNKKGECITIRDTNLDTVLNGGLYYIGGSCANLPNNCLGGYMCVLYHDLASNDYVTQILISWDGKKIYYRNKAGNWLNWKIISSTTVADVSKTVYSLDTSCDGVYKKGDTNTDNCWYAIRNGWCIVQIDLRCLQLNAGYICVSTSLPKPIATIANVFMSNDIVINEGDKPLIIIVGGDGVMKAEGGKLGGRYIGTFSYPVAE